MVKSEIFALSQPILSAVNPGATSQEERDLSRPAPFLGKKLRKM